MLTKNEKQKIWRKANPEKLREYKRRNYVKNKEVVLAERHRYYQKHKTTIQEKNRVYREKNLVRYLLSEAKKRALKSGLEFTITTSDIKIPLLCPILGIEIKLKLGTGQQDNSPSLDRIDNTKGYTPENTKVISHLANTMKNRATPGQLMAFAANILTYIGIV